MRRVGRLRQPRHLRRRACGPRSALTAAVVRRWRSLIGIVRGSVPRQPGPTVAHRRHVLCRDGAQHAAHRAVRAVLLRLPKLGIRYAPFVTAVIVLSVIHGRIRRRDVRAGINTVAAVKRRRRGRSGWRSRRCCDSWCCRRRCAPSSHRSGASFIALVKNSSIAYTISVVEHHRCRRPADHGDGQAAGGVHRRGRAPIWC